MIRDKVSLGIMQAHDQPQFLDNHVREISFRQCGSSGFNMDHGTGITVRRTSS